MLCIIWDHIALVRIELKTPTRLPVASRPIGFLMQNGPGSHNNLPNCTLHDILSYYKWGPIKSSANKTWQTRGTIGFPFHREYGREKELSG